jgi:hypothetical protein
VCTYIMGSYCVYVCMYVCIYVCISTNLEEEEIVDAPRNDVNASIPEQVKRPNPWRKMMMMMMMMYVYMYVFMYVCTHVCMYVCMYVRMYYTPNVPPCS